MGARLRAACLDKGFFYIKNHGVSESLVNDVFKEAAAFFSLPTEQKAEVDKAKSKANRGYEPLQGQTLEAGAPPDLKEGYYIGPEHGPDHPRVLAGMFNHGANQWPAQRPNFRPVMEAYLEVMLELSARMMRGIALSLEVPEDYFSHYCSDVMATVRLLHYPPQPVHALPGQKGAGAHTDFGGITLLRQDNVGGLQVWDQTVRRLDPRRPGAGGIHSQSRRHDRALDQRPLPLDGAPRRQHFGQASAIPFRFSIPATTPTRSSAFRPAWHQVKSRNIRRPLSKHTCARCIGGPTMADRQLGSPVPA